MRWSWQTLSGLRGKYEIAGFLVGRNPTAPMTAWSVWFLLFFALGLAALAGFAGHRITYLRMLQKARRANELVASLIAQSRRNETVAGAYALSFSSERAASALEGAEDCYYGPPDFERVTWAGKDMPTPFVGCAPIPGQFAGGFINSMQFRYAREIDVPKPRNVSRIFVTGGSTAYGSGATSNDTTIGGYLEKYLNEALLGRDARCEVVTAAACAWSSTHERILIENRLIELEPDMVISFSGHNDVFWGVAGRNVSWFRGFQDDYFFALANAALASNLAEEFPSQDPGAGTPVSSDVAARRLARNVAFSHHALATVGADYVFALQPVLEVSQKVRTPHEQQVAAAASGEAWFVQMESFYQDFRRSLQALEKPGFHFVDTTTIFDGCDDKIDLFVDTCHFGDRANDLIAQCLRGHVLTIIKERLPA